jgi:membrane protein implicated in regulation of membrane protease activity
MSGIYIFCLLVGLPLLLWMVFAGDGGEGDGLGVDGDGPLAVIPLSAVAFFLTAFGGIGVLGELTDTGFGVTLLAALAIGAGAGLGSRALFRWLGADSATSEVSDTELEGLIGRVSLPVSDRRRGRIVVEIAGAREQMTASPVDGSSIDKGERVVVVKVDKGVALVAPLGPDLELE